MDTIGTGEYPAENAGYEDNVGEDPGTDLREYDITATPNDFNVATIFSFIEHGTLAIPEFQRNYVWDVKRASKLIESLLLGLPVPQLFLFEEARNRFLVIDGQQRLLSVYFFKKQRFPRMDKRGQIRRIFDDNGQLPDAVLHDDEYFVPFKLSLPDRLPDHPSPFKGQNYSTLGEYQSVLDLRPIRNVVIRQNSPPGDKSSVFEIFSRLNTGGMNLTPQEIRASLFHSDFYDLIRKLNLERGWRRFIGAEDPDLHLKDVELILRGFAMLLVGDKYAPSMVQFLNRFSEGAKQYDEDKISYLHDVFVSFLQASSGLPDRAFINEGNNRFNVALYEATFTVICEPAIAEDDVVRGKIVASSVAALSQDGEFQAAAAKGAADSTNVMKRLSRARSLLMTEPGG